MNTIYPIKLDNLIISLIMVTCIGCSQISENAPPHSYKKHLNLHTNEHIVQSEISNLIIYYYNLDIYAGSERFQDIQQRNISIHPPEGVTQAYLLVNLSHIFDDQYIPTTPNTLHKQTFPIDTTGYDLSTNFRGIPMVAHIDILPEIPIINASCKPIISMCNIKIRNNIALPESLEIHSIQILDAPSHINLISSNQVPFPLIENTHFVDFKPTPLQSDSITLYLPANQRGIGSALSSYDKNYWSQPKDQQGYCTRLILTATHKKTSEHIGDTMLYTLYLGKNAYNDFNIVPNGKYSVELNFRGVSLYDTRISYKNGGHLNLSPIDTTHHDIIF